MENHPELFELAKSYEKSNPKTGERYTWSQGESLIELSAPERVKEIKANSGKAMEEKKVSQSNRSLVEILGDVLDDEDDEEPCLICDL